MYITRLYLKGFKPLALSNIAELEYHTDTPLQLILGQNGSGKSSVLRELSPLPAVPAQYYTGGIKEIDILHNGSEYRLRSVIGTTAKHSFIKDGVELNSGNGIAAIQKELIEREFNYTPTIQHLLTSGLSFCKLGTGQRRELLMSLADLQLDYVLSFYQRIKQAHRDTLGAIKHVQSKQATIATDLLTLGETESLMVEHGHLTDQLKQLIPVSVNRRTSPPSYQKAFEDQVSKLGQLISEYHTALSRRHPPYYQSLDDIIYHLDVSKQQRAVLKATIDSTLAELADIRKLADVVENTDNGREVLEGRAEMYREQLRRHVPVDGMVYSGSLSEVADELAVAADGLRQIYLNKDQDMEPCVQSDYKQMEDQIYAMQRDIQLLETRCRKIDEALIESQDHPNNVLICPKCATKIYGKMHLTDSEVVALKSQREVLQQQLDNSVKALEALRANYTLCDNYLHFQYRVQQYLYRFRTISAFLSELGTLAHITTHLPYVVECIRAEHARVQTILSHRKIQGELVEIEKYLQLHKLAIASGAPEKKHLLETKLDELYSQLKQTDSIVKEAQEAYQVHRQLLALYDVIQATAKTAEAAFLEWANETVYHDIGQKIQVLQSRLGDIQSILKKRDHLIAASKDADNDLSQLTKDKNGYDILLDEVSPTNGFIAEQLKGYLHSFITQINGVIESIWVYPMVIELPTLTDGDLTYKFPVVIGDSTIADISMASQGQQDIIDFAFTVVTMGYMGLSDYPLIMDEIGASFDYTHRSNLMTYIKSLLESRTCSQMFMVNHYTAEYGGLCNANILVLSENNIVLPATYNTRTRIQYG